MTYFIGGNSNGFKVDQDNLDCKDSSIVKPFGPLTGMQRKSETYIRTQITFQNETKTFYIIDGKDHKEFHDEIVGKWDWVETDTYSLD